MPYIRRDEAGKICGLDDSPQGAGAEEVSLTDAEVMAFLLGNERARGLPAGCDLHLPQCMDVVLGLQQHRDLMEQADLALIRVLEDLIDVLVNKGLVTFTDLPHAAQQKLLQRQQLRDEVHHGSLVVDDGDVL
ncbi:MAG TPA: hypothetical protein VIX81_02545 [Gammaproteobacteria bacterium]